MPCHRSLSNLLGMTKDWDFEAPGKYGDGALLPSFPGELMDTQKYNSYIFLWGYHCSFAMLSQYWKSFRSVFTKKIIIINKRPSGLSLGKQVTKELSKCFCLSEGQGFYGLVTSRSPAMSQARGKQIPNLPRGTTACSAILLSSTCHGQLCFCLRAMSTGWEFSVKKGGSHTDHQHSLEIPP